jgi:hypothetical protein
VNDPQTAAEIADVLGEGHPANAFLAGAPFGFKFGRA